MVGDDEAAADEEGEPRERVRGFGDVEGEVPGGGAEEVGAGEVQSRLSPGGENDAGDDGDEHCVDGAGYLNIYPPRGCDLFICPSYNDN